MLRGNAHAVHHQFLRYALVGTASFCVDLAVLALLVDGFGVHVLTAGAAAFVVGVTANYLLAIRWVFPHRSLRHRRHVEYAVYIGVGITGLGLNELVLWALAVEGGVHYAPSKAVSGLLVLLWTFVGRRTFLFRSRPHAGLPEQGHST